MIRRTVTMTSRPAPSQAPAPGLSSADRLVAGLEAIIDATAGILAAQSLQATLQAMADALAPIVPYTSLAVYEVDWSAREAIPLLATGIYVEQTMATTAPLDVTITGSAVLSGTLMCIEPDDPVIATSVMPGTPKDDLESIIVAPFVVGDRVEGTLNVWRERENVLFEPAEVMLIERFATLAAMAYANSTQRELLRTQALTDPLTGLYNRRHFQDSANAALRDGCRRGEPTSIAYFDIDAFKSINDSFGHACGDEALCAFAHALRGHTRAGDIACRTGGEEFCVVLPRTDADQAAALARRVNDAIREARLGPRENLTVSVGVATSTSCDEVLDDLLLQADAALLTAKRSGRDRVVTADTLAAPAVS